MNENMSFTMDDVSLSKKMKSINDIVIYLQYSNKTFFVTHEVFFFDQTIRIINP